MFLLAQIEGADVFKFIETGVIFTLFVWMITKAFPGLLEKHEAVQQGIRNEFTQTLTTINNERKETAKEGHQAAEKLSVAIEHQAESLTEQNKSLIEQARVIHESTMAIRDLTSEMKRRGFAIGEHQHS